MKIRKCLSYDDVLLAPQYSDIKSRSEVLIGSALDDDRRFDLPIISSPMDTLTESSMAAAMNTAGGLGAMAVELADVQTVAAAIGISGDYFERATELAK